jgi:hypothetical protein
MAARAEKRPWSWQKKLAAGCVVGGTLLGGWPQAVVVVVLLLLLAGKGLAIVRAVGWAAQHASGYSADFKRTKPQTVQEGIDLLRNSGAHFRPFGIKDHRLRERVLPCPSDTPARARGRRCLAELASFCFGARPLVKTAAAVCLLADLRLDRRESTVHVPGLDLPLVVVLAVTMAAVSTVLVVEAVTWYVTAGSYARPFHMLGFAAEQAQPPASAEIRVFARLTGYAVVADIVACTAVQRFSGGFTAAAEGGGLAAEIDRLTHFAYFALSSLTTTGGSPVDPQSSLANLLSALLMTQTLLIVVFALTLASSLLREDAATDSELRAASPADDGRTTPGTPVPHPRDAADEVAEEPRSAG